MNAKVNASERSGAKKTRHAMVSGIFYPSSAQELSSKIDSLLDSAEVPENAFSAIVSPHGSLDYSGLLAAQAWKAASSPAVDTLVIIGPSHRSFEPGIFLPESHSFSIPTGTFGIDRKIIKELFHCSTVFAANDIPHMEEHAIEVQLPFAASCFSGSSIIPILVSGGDESMVKELFLCLHYCLRERLSSTLLVLTSNMAVEDNEEDCTRQTQKFVESVMRKDLAGLEALSASSPSFCGGKIIAAYLRSAFASDRGTIAFGAGTSVKFTEAGDPVVGYASIGFLR